MPDGDLREPAISVLVVQPTPFCNIDCAYCYLPDRANNAQMSRETLSALFEKVFASGWTTKQLTVIWHAGEPLVMPVTYYEDAFNLIESLRPRDMQLRHSFQTNGTLLSKRWCDLFRHWDVGVGVSIDGPRRFNDAHRVSRNGRSTFDRTLAGIRLLRSESVPFHVISVLTNQSLDAPDEMLKFYRAEGIENICFNVEESEGDHISELFGSPAPQQRFRRFLSRFWQEARRDDRIHLIREIDGMIPRVFRPQDTEVTNLQVEPLSMVNVDWRGNVSSFSPELLGLKSDRYNDFIIGNVLTHSMEEMRRSSTMQTLARDIRAGVARCKASCEYFSVCGGGAPINKLTENGAFDSERTVFCALTQMVPVDLILQACDQLQRDAERQTPQQLMQELARRSATVPVEMRV